MIRLLEKKLVNAGIATERKEQISSGIKLAEKVDNVRATLEEETKRLADFRRESVAHIQVEIDRKIRERDRLDDEIRLKSTQSQVLLAPVEEQWKQVEKAKADIELQRQGIATQKFDLQKGIALNIQRERENKEETQRLDQERRLTDEARSNADQAEKDEIAHLLKARADADVIVGEAKEREEAVAVREGDIAGRENEVAKNLRLVANWEIDLKNRERALKDKYETLERTIKRMK